MSRGRKIPLLGAHQSIAGGYHKALETGQRNSCQVIQVFTKNTNQWRSRPILADEARQFREAVTATGIACPLAHDSYLINLASPEKILWKKSIDASIDEMRRAAILGIPWVVAHPGAYTTASEAEGLRRVVAALDEVLNQTSELATGILIETTAGQGTTLGWRFEHLAEIFTGVSGNARLGACFDTCHVFAAGYPLATEAGYRKTMRQFARIVGLERIRAFHLNDSLKDCGSRVDRHAHVGCGKIGLEAFRCLLRDRRFRSVPMVLETPKGTENGEEWDVVNLRKLRELTELS